MSELQVMQAWATGAQVSGPRATHSAPWQQPFGQVVSLQLEQAPLSQESPVGQVLHAMPPAPQESGWVPASHV